MLVTNVLIYLLKSEMSCEVFLLTILSQGTPPESPQPGRVIGGWVDLIVRCLRGLEMVGMESPQAIVTSQGWTGNSW